MATYKYKLYQRPGGPETAGQLVDKLTIEADDDASAIQQAKSVRAPFEFEADYVALCNHDYTVIWHREPPGA